MFIHLFIFIKGLDYNTLQKILNNQMKSVILGILLLGFFSNKEHAFNKGIRKSFSLESSIKSWKSDSSGCSRIRNTNLFYSIYDSIPIKDINSVFEYLGKPNKKMDTLDLVGEVIVFDYLFNCQCINGRRLVEYSVIRLAFRKQDSKLYNLWIFDH